MRRRNGGGVAVASSETSSVRDFVRSLAVREIYLKGHGETIFMSEHLVMAHPGARRWHTGGNFGRHLRSIALSIRTLVLEHSVGRYIEQSRDPVNAYTSHPMLICFAVKSFLLTPSVISRANIRRTSDESNVGKGLNANG